MDVAIGLNRLVDGGASRTAVINRGKLLAACARGVLNLDLCGHGRSMRFTQSYKFRGAGTNLDSA